VHPGALPRLARGEGWVWAPGDGVVARVAFPRIRTLDSSQTPRREAQASTPRALAAVDLSALRAALVGMTGDDANSAESGRSHGWELEQRLSQRERELAAALAEITELKTEAAAMHSVPSMNVGSAPGRSVVTVQIEKA